MSIRTVTRASRMHGKETKTMKVAALHLCTSLGWRDRVELNKKRKRFAMIRVLLETHISPAHAYDHEVEYPKLEHSPQRCGIRRHEYLRTFTKSLTLIPPSPSSIVDTPLPSGCAVDPVWPCSPFSSRGLPFSSVDPSSPPARSVRSREAATLVEIPSMDTPSAETCVLYI